MNPTPSLALWNAKSAMRSSPHGSWGIKYDGEGDFVRFEAYVGECTFVAMRMVFRGDEGALHISMDRSSIESCVVIMQHGGETVKKFLIFAVAAAGLMSVSTAANAFPATKCKACHSVAHDKVGPSWKSIAAAYGDEATLAKVFDSGFAVADRKVAASNSKWKHKAGMMTGQYKRLIKGHGKEAAHALFESVKAGKIGNY